MVFHPLYIMLTDKNRHVRNYIKRELIAEGYSVIKAMDCLQVRRYLAYGLKVDLLILDPELQCNSFAALLREIQDHAPHLPVIIHGFDEYQTNMENDCQIHFVEKQAGSIEQLKRIIREILISCTPVSARS